MLIGVPKEIKNHEYRVGMTPLSVREAVRHGHKVWVEANAGGGIGATDEDYTKAGATIIKTAAEIFAKAEMIVKVKEPQAVERKMLREGQILYTYLHLAPDPEQTKDLVKSGAVCIAYETVTSPRGGLPLLAPMSQVAGRMSVQAGAHCLEKAQGGRGVLLGGVPGVAPAKVVILGGGVVGTNAAAMALGLGADVTILEKSTDRMEELVARFGTQLKTLYSTQGAVEDECADGRSGDRRRAHSGRRGAQARSPARCSRTGSRARCWSMSRSTRAAAPRPRRPRPMPIRPMWSTASSITASPTCRAGWRARRPSRSTT